MSSSATSWSCQIALSISVDHGGNDIWTSEITPFGPLIEDKGLEEIWLRRAQAALLSPHLPTEEFHNKTVAELREMTRTDLNMLPFTGNVVKIEVKDPTLTDLSFIDLPGMIPLTFLISLYPKSHHSSPGRLNSQS